MLRQFSAAIHGRLAALASCSGRAAVAPNAARPFGSGSPAPSLRSYARLVRAASMRRARFSPRASMPA